MENCPKCGYQNEESSVECVSCGVILNKEKLLEQIRAKEEALSVKQETLKKTRTLREAKHQDLKAETKAKMTGYSFRREINLPIEKVWSLLGDFTRAPGPEIQVVVEKEGDINTNGVGTIRKITIGKVCVREILDSANPPYSYSYRILSGAPVKQYFGKVKLEPREGSTIIHWHAFLTPKIPCTGWICSKVASEAQHCLIDAVEKSN